MNFIYLFFAFSSLFVLGLLDNLRGPLYADLLRDLQISNALGGWFFALTSLLSGVFAFLSRYFLKHISYLLGLRLGLMGMSLGFFMVSRSSDSFSLLLSASIFGVGYGLVSVAQNVLCQEGATDSSRRKVLSFYQSMYAIASWLSPLFVGVLLSKEYTWREVFLGSSFLPLFLAFLPWGLKRTPRVQEEKDGVSLGSTHFDQILVALSFSFYVSAEILFSSRFSLYLQNEKGLDSSTASFHLSYFFLGLLLGRVGSAFLPHKISSEKFLLFLLSTSAFGSLLTLLVSPYFLIFVGFCMGPVFPYVLDGMAKWFPNEKESAVSYLIFFMSAGLVAMHFGVGVLTENLGIQRAMLMVPLFLVLSIFGFSFFLRKKKSGSF